MNNEGKQLLFVVNKYAGTGYQSKVEGRIVDVCAQHDAECTVEFTQGRGHATELAREGVRKGFDAVVAVGGDGTLYATDARHTDSLYRFIAPSASDPDGEWEPVGEFSFEDFGEDTGLANYRGLGGNETNLYMVTEGGGALPGWEDSG
ncbi:MAG: acylglycerol kinase family protein, partial [Bacteroidia bacterium]|nr:acylglycerol kinase family protein [Bacteroidia bacterium]